MILFCLLLLQTSLVRCTQETIDKLRVRNVELLSERDTLRLRVGGDDGGGGGGGAGDLQVQDLIQGYIQEIEELR